MSIVSTKHVKGRRTLHFASIEDAIRDAQLLADAEANGTLKRLGNWPLGQMFGHVAGWMNFAFDGYPPDLRPPWILKVVLRTMKSRFMRGMPAGVRIGKIEGGTKNLEPLSTAEGLARLKGAWQRMGQSAPTQANPIFGPLSHEEWITMNLRHAELHQSFYLP